jgi:uncharacterized protein YcgI (DUF1989 family)
MPEGEHSMSGTRDASATLPKYSLDTSFYEKVRSAKHTHKLIERFIISPYSGRGFIAKRGHTFRVIDEEGPQVADVMLWNAHDKTEYFSMARTWLMEGMFVRPLTRLWSDVPRFRPIAICTDETVDSRKPDGDYGHHFVKTHCCPEVMEARLGKAGLNACHLNLLQAIEPFSLGESDMHDNINVHQKVRIDVKTGKSVSQRSASQAGDYIEFYANIDLLVAVSVCPNGDNTAHQAAIVRPIGIEIYDTYTEPPDFPKWTDWRPGWKGRWVPSEIS